MSMTTSRGPFFVPLAVVLVLCGASDLVRADAVFTSLGTLGGGSSEAAAVSADGRIVVGTSIAGSEQEAFRWDQTSGMVGLGQLQSGGSRATDVSGDGSVVVGQSVVDGKFMALRWTSGDGMVPLGAFDGGSSIAKAVSPDGSFVVGESGLLPCDSTALGGNSCERDPTLPGTVRAFRWSNASGQEDLGVGPSFEGTSAGCERPFSEGEKGATAQAVLNDGSTVGYTYRNSQFCFVQHGGGCVWHRRGDSATRWSPAGVASALESGLITAADVSADGQIIAGACQTGGLQRDNQFMPIFDSENNASTVRAMSADGSVLAGSFGLYKDGVPARLKTLLMSLYDVDLTGWTLDFFGDVSAVDVSADGRVFVGTGINPLNELEAWRIEFDELPSATDLSSLPRRVPHTTRQIEGPTPDTLLAALLPRGRSAQVNETVTVFATILNNTDTDAVGCRVGLGADVPVDFDYHITDPATNVAIGIQNTPANIPAREFQTFVVGFTPSAEFPNTEVQLNYDCTNGEPAVYDPSVNAITLSASTTPTPDVVAIAATVSDNGVVLLDTTDNRGAFVVASVNVGSAAPITVAPFVSSNLGDTLRAAICQTDTQSGECLAPAAAAVTLQLGELETASFGIFVDSDGIVSFNASKSRVFVNFEEADGTLRGSTSVAVNSG